MRGRNSGAGAQRPVRSGGDRFGSGFKPASTGNSFGSSR